MKKGCFLPFKYIYSHKHILKSVLFIKTIPLSHFLLLLIDPMSAVTVRRKTHDFPCVKTIQTSFYLNMVKAVLSGHFKLLTININLILF